MEDLDSTYRVLTLWPSTMLFALRPLGSGWLEVPGWRYILASLPPCRLGKGQSRRSLLDVAGFPTILLASKLLVFILRVIMLRVGLLSNGNAEAMCLLLVRVV